VLLAVSGRVRADEDFFESVDDHLKFSADNGNVTGRISGLLDMEEYYVQQPAPSLLYEDHSFLFSPRLTLNLDLQLGPQVYVFAQARADRGFDPSSDSDGQVRADQYAIRYTPWEDGALNIQAGKFATVVGNWAHRDDSWTNPFVTAPLLYENLTSVWDIAGAYPGVTLNSWINTPKNLRLPIIWEGSYASGVSAFGSLGQFDYAVEMKNAGISSRPEAWSVTDVGFDHPVFSGRVGWRPDEAWNLGVSSSVGTYLRPIASNTLMPGTDLDDYRQITIAQDLSFAWHHWQFWAECYETRFEVPAVGNADTLAYYVEVRYKFTPEFSAALRWNQQFFNTIPGGFGEQTTWGCEAGRIDAAMTYRFSPNMQAKLQYSFLDQGAPFPEAQHLVAAQFTVRF